MVFAPRCVHRIGQPFEEDVLGGLGLGCLTAGGGGGIARQHAVEIQHVEARRRDGDGGGGLRQRALSGPRARGLALLGGTRCGTCLSVLVRRVVVYRADALAQRLSALFPCCRARHIQYLFLSWPPTRLARAADGSPRARACMQIRTHYDDHMITSWPRRIASRHLK